MIRLATYLFVRLPFIYFFIHLFFNSSTFIYSFLNAPLFYVRNDYFISFACFIGNIDVYICPGDHLALSEPDDGAVVGAILATAVGLRYRALYPSLPRLPTTFKERRAIHKFEAGIEVLLYSRKGIGLFSSTM